MQRLILGSTMPGATELTRLSRAGTMLKLQSRVFILFMDVEGESHVTYRYRFFAAELIRCCIKKYFSICDFYIKNSIKKR
jgi:hypothetical protein